MGQTIRFGVSLNSELLEKFDALCDEKSYQTRSEAIRDLIRGVLVQKEWEQSDMEVAGVLTLVYDHHTSDLAQRLIEIQHEDHDLILCSMHVHLDHHNCLEIVAVKGRAHEVEKLAHALRSVKGVRHGTLSMTSTGKAID